MMDLTMILALLLLLALLLPLRVDAIYSGLGTIDGYDNINGHRPVCWISKKTTDFLEHQAVKIQPSCPDRNELHLQMPTKWSDGEIYLRTNQNHTFQLVAKIDLYSIRKTYGLSHEATFDGDFEARMSFCPINGIFCTPFIGETANGGAGGGGGEKRQLQHQLIKYGVSSNSTTSAENDTADNRSFDQIRKLRGSDRIETVQSFNFTTEGSLTEVLEPASQSSVSSFVSISDLPNQTNFVLHLNFTINVNVPDIILPLGSLRLYIKNGTDGDTIQLDMANILHAQTGRQSVVFQLPPDIRSVHPIVEGVSYVIIAFSDLVQFVFLAMTVHYRKESVMTLSQGSFMILLQIAGIVATTSSFLYLPKSDMYCLLSHPLTLVPFQFMLAIIISRLWRTITLLESVMNWNQSSRSSRQLRIPRPVLRRRNSHDSIASMGSSVMSSDNTKLRHALNGVNHMRTKFTIKWLWILIVSITLPQVIAQIIANLTYPPHLEISLNADQSVGRFECGTDDDQWFHLATTSITVVTLFIAIYVSQRSNSLPALFNEATSVSSALVVSLFVTVFAYAMRVISDTPTSSPGVSYVMMVIIVNNFALNISIRLVLPKLRLIWKGEKVVVSKLVTDHRMKAKEEEEQINLTVEFVERANQVISAESSVDASSGEQQSRRWSNMSPGRRFSSTKQSLGMEMCGLDDPSQTAALDDSDYTTLLGRSLKRSESDGLMELSSLQNSDTEVFSTNRPDFSMAPPSRRKSDWRGRGTPLVICEADGPPPDLLVKILSLKHRIGRINNRIFSGLMVEEGEWESLRAELRSTSSFMKNVQYKKG